MADTLNPMELLKEEMENDDISHRINAMHRMRIVATLLGPEGIKSQLLPYLDGVIKKEDDEVLFAVAEEIGYFAPILGQQCLILLPYLENLASVEETVVRDQSVKSLIMIANQLTDAEIVNNFAPLVLKLANGEWFTSRVSAVNMIPSIYTRSGNQKVHLKQKFIELCGEETPMVRRAVAMKIGDLASCVEKDVLHELITIFKQLTGDEQDSVKMLCLDSLRQIAKVLNKDENKTHTLPVIIAATEDKSWRVRQAISKNFAQIAEALGKEITENHLIQNFTVVLRDAEVDVRHVAIGSLKSLLTMNLLSQEKILTLIPHIQALAKDSNPIVKINITHVLNITVPLVGKETALTKLLPNALDLIEDDDSETRIEAFKIIVKFAQVIGTDIMTTLLPHIKTILTNHKWRVRIAALDCVIDLALLFQNPDLFKSQLEPLFFIFLSDKAASVREVGIRRLGEIITTYKQPWLDGVLFPKVLDILKQETTYLFKATGLYSLRAIASVMPPDYVHDKIIPPLVRLARDPVPNVRFVAVKVIKASLPRIDETTKASTIKPLLTELAGDSDKDVVFFSQEALASL